MFYSVLAIKIFDFKVLYVINSRVYTSRHYGMLLNHLKIEKYRL